jgi:hypothetical protein
MERLFRSCPKVERIGLRKKARERESRVTQAFLLQRPLFPSFVRTYRTTWPRSSPFGCCVVCTFT